MSLNYIELHHLTASKIISFLILKTSFSLVRRPPKLASLTLCQDSMIRFQGNRGQPSDFIGTHVSHMLSEVFAYGTHHLILLSRC